MRRIVIACVVVNLLVGSLAAIAQTVVRPPASRPAPRPPATTAPATQPATATPAQTNPVTAVPAAKPDPVDPAWLEKLKDEDRESIEELRTYAVPALGSDLAWLPEKPGTAAVPLTWGELRGKVIVLQSFTTANIVGRKWPDRVAMALKSFPAKDLRIIALHTPEKADHAADFLSRQPLAAGPIIAIDAKGATCDALGIYKAPVNIVIDRQGVVRFVGLNERGLVQAVNQLAQEKFDSTKQPPVRTASTSPASGKGDWPSIAGRVQFADDIRGKPAPEFFADEWITNQPELRNRVVVIDFWATWCKPCVEAIPHMNELADKFGDRATFIGISSEKQAKFQEGLRKINYKPESFHYGVALDPHDTMYGAIHITAIPHCIVISSDWIVRWQGSPTQLNEKVLEQIINADAVVTGKGGGGTTKPGKSHHRWTES